MSGFLRTDVLKCSISGITGHPVKYQKMLVIYLSLSCWMQKYVCDYLVPLANGSEKASGVA
jgi:hypothetical protein